VQKVSQTRSLDGQPPEPGKARHALPVEHSEEPNPIGRLSDEVAPDRRRFRHVLWSSFLGELSDQPKWLKEFAVERGVDL